MVGQKAGGAMLGSTIMVMAWTGVYFSRQTRSVDDSQALVNWNSTINFYQIVNEEEYFNVTSSESVKREKIKEVNSFSSFQISFLFCITGKKFHIV